jgi:succinate dehydrogenase / fumarate reductase cytochrome b subunit
MSKSAILSSSIAKKWWMALTGLFLCVFLVGHLAGNLQLLENSVEGKRAFNEYAHFMATNIFIKVLSWLTYISILFHAIDGIMLTIQNKKSRPVKYAYEKPNTNSKWYARSMAILGSLILIFIVLHMQHFWYKVKVSSAPVPLHTENMYQPQMVSQGVVQDTVVKVYYTTSGSYIPVAEVKVKGKDFYSNTEKQTEQIQGQYDPSYQPKGENPKIGQGYKDLYSIVYAFFGHDKSQDGVTDADIKGLSANKNAIFFVILYVLSMVVLSFHLMHGFASAFQSLGINHKRYNKLIKVVGTAFAILVPALFAIIPVFIYLSK